MIFYKETMNEAFVRVVDNIMNCVGFEYDDKISAIKGAQLMLEEVLRTQEEKDGGSLGQSG